MKVICVFACWLAVAYGGVIKWSHSGEEYAHNLYKQYCGHSPTGENNGIHWHCKHTDDLSDEFYEHSDYHIPKGDTPVQKQVIFLQTPGKTVRHKVKVHGEAGVKQDTNIYVLPPKIRHSLDISGGITNTGELSKPRTFFLKHDPGSSSGHGHHPPPTSGWKPSPPVSSGWSDSGSGYSSHYAASSPDAYAIPFEAPIEVAPAVQYESGHKHHRKRSHGHGHSSKRNRAPTSAPTFEALIDDGDYAV